MGSIWREGLREGRLGSESVQVGEEDKHVGTHKGKVRHREGH